MGNSRFKLSDMIPNVWFHKLKYMTKHKEDQHNPKLITNYKSHSTPSSLLSNPSQNHVITTQQQQHFSERRKSYYFNRDFTENKKSSDPPRKSSSRRRRLSTKRNTRIYNSPPRLQVMSSSVSCRSTTFESAVSTAQPNDSIITPIFQTPSPSDQDDDHSPSWSNSCQCSLKNDDDDDYRVLDDTKEYNHTSSNISNKLFQQTIPRIVTKKKPKGPTENLRTSGEFHEPKTRLSVKVAREETTSTRSASKRNNHHNKTNNVLSTSPVRLSSASSSSQCGVRLRTNSPRMRIQTRNKIVGYSTRSGSVSQSFAEVKASRDPERDFRKSMVEMIVENDITKSKDLEELLSCYLSLNSDEYHGMIINVFSQIWFEFARVRLN